MESSRWLFQPRYELFLRGTAFSRVLLTQLWEALDHIVRIDFLLTLRDGLGPILADEPWTDELVIKAVEDPQPLVRMLAAQWLYTVRDDRCEALYEALQQDPSPVVRAAVVRPFNERDYKASPQELRTTEQLVRLGCIALSEEGYGLDEDVFSDFLISGLGDGTLSESDARDLVLEWVANPALRRRVSERVYYVAEDGFTDWSRSKEFETIWKLTLSTPREVHRPILGRYPLCRGDSWQHLPDEVLEGLGPDGLGDLVWRSYEPLLERMREEPGEFADAVHEAARRADEFRREHALRDQDRKQSDLALLHAEVANLRSELNEWMEDLSQSLGQRRGFFSRKE